MHKERVAALEEHNLRRLGSARLVRQITDVMHNGQETTYSDDRNLTVLAYD